MRTTRQAIALDPRLFGRRALAASAQARPSSSPDDDLRLFATTFAAGFLFVSVLIA